MGPTTTGHTSLTTTAVDFRVVSGVNRSSMPRVILCLSRRGAHTSMEVPQPSRRASQLSRSTPPAAAGAPSTRSPGPLGASPPSPAGLVFVGSWSQAHLSDSAMLGPGAWDGDLSGSTRRVSVSEESVMRQALVDTEHAGRRHERQQEQTAFATMERRFAAQRELIINTEHRLATAATRAAALSAGASPSGSSLASGGGAGDTSPAGVSVFLDAAALALKPWLLPASRLRPILKPWSRVEVAGPVNTRRAIAMAHQNHHAAASSSGQPSPGDAEQLLSASTMSNSGRGWDALRKNLQPQTTGGGGRVRGKLRALRLVDDSTHSSPAAGGLTGTGRSGMRGDTGGLSVRFARAVVIVPIPPRDLGSLDDDLFGFPATGKKRGGSMSPATKGISPPGAVLTANITGEEYDGLPELDDAPYEPYEGELLISSSDDDSDGEEPPPMSPTTTSAGAERRPSGRRKAQKTSPAGSSRQASRDSSKRRTRKLAKDAPLAANAGVGPEHEKMLLHSALSLKLGGGTGAAKGDGSGKSNTTTDSSGARSNNSALHDIFSQFLAEADAINGEDDAAASTNVPHPRLVVERADDADDDRRLSVGKAINTSTSGALAASATPPTPRLDESSRSGTPQPGSPQSTTFLGPTCFGRGRERRRERRGEDERRGGGGEAADGGCRATRTRPAI
jgi:hypothetical protein